MEAAQDSSKMNESDTYLNSYSDLDIHKLMLEDVERVNAYKRGIERIKGQFKNKTVMDVGAGTGILSILCAKAGASKVYAVEASNIAFIAKNIIKENKMESVVQVVHCKVEDISLPDQEKVDIIVSEWMGFYLLHEGMLDSVIFARDKFLKPGGLILPESATIYMAPCSVPSMYDQWNDIHGVKMKSMGSALRKSKCDKPEVMQIDMTHLLAPKTALCWIDLKDVTVPDLDSFTMRHIIGAGRDGLYQGMCVWFDCQFPVPYESDDEPPVFLDTSPYDPPTHWKQTVIVLPEEISIDKGQPIAWELTMSRSEECTRRYDLQLTMLDPELETHPTPCTCHMTKCIVIRAFLDQNPNGEEPFGVKENNDKESVSSLSDSL